MTTANGSDYSLIALERFIQSTRDSGYKTTASAVSELVDNSLQAGATQVRILVREVDDELCVCVIDNGRGMDSAALREALRFGGSSRFNDRRGMGRYGMGLPNASVSQTKRVTVYSWRAGRTPHYTYLDVDEIARGELKTIPPPRPKRLPSWMEPPESSSGTAVAWEKCDRLDHRRVSTTCRKLHETLGRTYRNFIWNGVQIEINGQIVPGVDPLFLHESSPQTGATAFGEKVEFEIYCRPTDAGAGTGTVQVVFSELPVAQWQSLSVDEKRRMGISNGAGVSVVRAGREVDFGWFFLAGKRRENYDDWWRCEVSFDPKLDEAFGIAHTKQQIRPQAHLLEAIQPHMEMMARALNGRARDAHFQVKTAKISTPAFDIAAAREERLRPLPIRSALLSKQKELAELRKRNAALRGSSKPKTGEVTYRLVEDAAGDPCFYRPLLSESEVVGVLNTKHSFFRRLYEPLLQSESPITQDIARHLQLFLLAGARAEATFTRKDELAVIEAFRKEWSEILEVLLSSK